MRASARARHASDTRPAHLLARSGLAARGIIWILIGWVAVSVALGHSSHQADQQGALQMLAGEPYGLVLLWLLGIGFAGYALWRLSEAAFGVTGEGTGAGTRLKALGSAVVYGFFAYLTFEIIAGHHSNQTRREQDLTAKLMHDGVGGRWLVGVAGVIIVVAGIVLITGGIRRKFLKYLQTAQMSSRTRRVVERLGVVGTVARGVVIGLTGVGVIDAAVTFKPSKAGGLDKALLTLRNQPFGEFLLIIAALGLITFGIYCLCEARWRKV
jgi:amino acid transporter